MEQIKIQDFIGKCEFHPVENRFEGLFANEGFSLEILNALASSYLTMHLVDLDKDLIVEITSTMPVRKFWDYNLPAQLQLKKIYDKLLPDSEKKRVFEFIDFTTLPQRLKGKKLVSIEYLSMYRGWVRSTFIPVRYDKDGLTNFVIYYTRTIDEEKRREEELILRMNKDELTGLFNRRAYEEAIKTLKQNNVPDNTVLFSVDINSLKEVNDKYGHDGGDKLLKGASECLKETIGKFGNIYRIGGDEFIGIVQMTCDLIGKTENELKSLCNEWTAKNGLNLQLSVGAISKAHHADLELSDLLKFADKRMYRDKAKYYSKLGIDRRSLNADFSSVSRSYIKILKVNLADETYEILKVNFDLHDDESDVKDKISDWLKNFALNGGVRADDVESFKEFLNIDRIRAHFGLGAVAEGGSSAVGESDSSAVAASGSSAVGGMPQSGSSAVAECGLSAVGGSCGPSVEPEIMKAFYHRRYGATYKLVMCEIIPSVDFSAKNAIVYFCVKEIE